MARIKLFLFGIPRLERDGAALDLSLRKATALLSYLALRGQPQSRDFLAALLWPESPQATARANLRRTLYQLQQLLGAGVLQVSREEVGIAPGAKFWLDVKEFEAGIAGYLQDGSLAGEGGQEGIARLEAAAAQYQGDFMSGFSIGDSPQFEEWLFFESEGLRQKLARILESLSRLHLSNNNFPSAIPHARRWLNLDHLHEPAHRMLMELYSRSGQPSAAIRQYHECCRQLEESLGIGPEAATVELYEDIRSGKALLPAPAAFQIPEIHYVQSGEVNIAYQVLGAGPVDLLIVPGFVSHLEQIWESPSLAQSLRHLAGLARLILFDKRGVGLSDRVGYPPTLEHTMDDILSVLSAVGSPRAVFLGFSEGGPGSLVFCAAHPEHVLGLILYGTMAKGKRSADYPWALTEEQYEKWRSWLVNVWGRPVPHAYFAPSHETDTALWEWFARLLRLGSSPGGILGVLEVLKDIDVRQILPTIRVPTLIIHRSGDQVMRVGAGRYLAENIPEAHYVELPGDDHWWWLGDSGQVMKEIEAFLGNLKPPALADKTLSTILCAGPLLPGTGSAALQGWWEKTLQQEVDRFHGRQVRGKSGGGPYLMTFDGPSRAIRCALALQDLARQHRLPVRLGLHSGECVLAGRDEIDGPAVETAMAIMETAGRSELLVSRTVKELVVGAGFSFDRMPAKRAGSKGGTLELFKVVS